MTIKKVATMAGVSIATVSRFFNNPNQVSENTRRRVESAIQDIKYTPNRLAQNLRRGKTGLIIAVIPNMGFFTYEPMLNQLNEYAKGFGYTLLIQEVPPNTDFSLSHFQEMLQCKQADGFILFTSMECNVPTEKSSHFPIIMAGEPLPNNSTVELPSITINHYRAGRDATQYLIKLGHRDIAYLTSHPHRVSSNQRQLGYLNAMEHEKLSVFGRTVTHLEKTVSLEDKIETLLATKSRLTALLCEDDDTALCAMKIIKAKGYSVPKDISIMGFNNIRYSELSDPSLSTIEIPVAQISEQIIDTLIKIIDKHAFNIQPIILQHSLVIRDSTSPPTPQ